MADMLREAVDRGGEAVLDALSEALLGQACTVVRRSYPDVLVVEFDEWSLYAEATHWDVETDTGVVATGPPFPDDVLDTVRAALVGARLSGVRSRRAATALTIEFDRASLELHPAAGTSAELAWQLATPFGWTLLARQDQRFEAVDNEASFRFGGVPVVTTNFDAILETAIAALGWPRYAPVVHGDLAFDMVLIAPGHKPFLIEIKHHGIDVVLPDDRRVDVPVISREQLVEALSRLAA